MVSFVAGSPPVTAHPGHVESATTDDVSRRDRLVVDQEALLNTYRCMFDVDTTLVPAGCTNDRPTRPPPDPPPFTGTPTPDDVTTRDHLIENQETLLNTYRCMFHIDTHIVPNNCNPTTKDKDTSSQKEDKSVEQSSSTTTTIPKTTSISSSQPFADSLASRVEKLEAKTPRYLVEIANAMRLTDKGKEVFYLTDIRIQSSVPCVCYYTSGTIYVTADDPGYQYTVIGDLMHEFLHAVYFQKLVGSDQFDEITEELRQFYVKSGFLQTYMGTYINQGRVPENPLQTNPNHTVFLSELHSMAAADIDYESQLMMSEKLDNYYDQYFEDWQWLIYQTQGGYNEDFEHLVFP